MRRRSFNDLLGRIPRQGATANQGLGLLATSMAGASTYSRSMTSRDLGKDGLVLRVVGHVVNAAGRGLSCAQPGFFGSSLRV
jgi:hypothetical protein